MDIAKTISDAVAAVLAERGIHGYAQVVEPAIRQALGDGEAVGWHTEDHLTDKSATTYSKEVADRWRAKGWPVTPLYTHPDAGRVAELERVKAGQLAKIGELLRRNAALEAQLAESREREGRMREALEAMLEIHGVTQRYADTHIEIPQSWVEVSEMARAALAAEKEGE